MKKLAIISAIAMSGLFYNAANAQFGIHIGIRLFPHRVYVPRPVVVVQPQEPVYQDQQPVYQDDQEPVVSDNDDCDFYYLPDVGAYYSVNDQCYYYQDGDNWVSAAYLPGVYHDFDWRYAARRIEIRQPRPFMHNDFYRNRYQGFDRNIARYHDDFRMGFDYRHNSYAYNNDHRFDNRGGLGQHFDNNDRRFNNRGGYDQHFDNRGQDNSRFGQGNQNRDRNNYSNGRQNDQNQYRDRGNQNDQRVAQNNNGFGGWGHNKRDRF